jgi:hypothetical protein
VRLLQEAVSLVENRAMLAAPSNKSLVLHTETGGIGMTVLSKKWTIIIALLSLALLCVVCTMSWDGPIVKLLFGLVLVVTILGWFAVRKRSVNPAINFWFIGMIILASGGLLPSTLPSLTSQLCFGVGFCLIILASFRMRRKKQE